MPPYGTTVLIYVISCYMGTAVYGQGLIRECTTAEIANCSDIVNFTSLMRNNYTAIRRFCGDDYIRFKSCMEPLRDLCSPVVLTLLDDLVSTLRYMCDPEQQSLLQEMTTCLAGTDVTSHISQCQRKFEDGIGKSGSVGGICQNMVDFLSCCRWTAWVTCGQDAAEYMYRIQSHWVNMTIGTLGCTTASREAPTGLLWSYVIQGYSFWTPSTSTIMQLTGDPEAWVPDYLSTGNVSRRYISNNNMATFGPLAADYWHNKLLWVDMTGASAHSAPIYFFERESVQSTLVFGGMSNNVTAIAVDWVSENLYWTDAGYKWIGLVPYKTGHLGHHVILFEDNLARPSGIITDPANRLLYWSDVDRGVIEMSSLSGKNRSILRQDLDMPTSLALDYVTSYLYWLGRDRHTIYVMDTRGGPAREIRVEGMSVIYNDITVYEDYIFVTVNKADLIIYSKNNGTKLNKIGLVINRNYEETYAVTVSAPSKQQPVNSRCFYDNGGCHQICISSSDSPDGVDCLCTVGYHLAEDQKSCVSELFTDNFLIVADSYGKDLYMISLDNGSLTSIPIDPDSVPQAVEFLPEDQDILWYDETTNSLKRTTLSDRSTRPIHYFGTAVIRSIAYDGVKKRLYFSDAGSGKIKYFSLATNFSTESTVIQADIPADITLDANNRVIYWTEWKAIFSQAGIYSANMDDGSAKKSIVRGEMYYPSGLNIDFKDKLMYWCDAYTDTVERYNLESSERATLINMTGSAFYSMSMDADYLYISDLHSRNLLRYEIKTSSHEQFGPKVIQKGVSLKLYRSRLQGRDELSPTERFPVTTRSSRGLTSTTTRASLSTTQPSGSTDVSSYTSSVQHLSTSITSSSSPQSTSTSTVRRTPNVGELTTEGASNQPEVAASRELSDGGKAGIIVAAIVFVVVMATVIVVLYRRRSLPAGLFQSRMFSSRRMEETDDIVVIDPDRSLKREVDV